MNEWIQSGVVKEIQASQNIAFILEDNSLFSLTGYKVLKSQGKNGLLDCTKVKYNGKIKLIYFTSQYKSLKNMIPVLSVKTFLTVIANLFSTIIEIQNNGFLICQNLNLDMDKVFIDPNTLAVRLVYIPINTTTVDISAFEYELRADILRLITSIPAIRNEETKRLELNLSNGTISLKELYKSFFSENRESLFSEKNYDANKEQPELIFESLESGKDVEFKINKPQFVIGKNVNSVDGAISYNKAISRTHCKIVYQNDRYEIIDLGSANGSYLNKKKLTPYQKYQIRSGDIVRLANSDFLIKI